jgi:hypothetical protein
MIYRLGAPYYTTGIYFSIPFIVVGIYSIRQYCIARGKLQVSGEKSYSMYLSFGNMISGAG